MCVEGEGEYSFKKILKQKSKYLQYKSLQIKINV